MANGSTESDAETLLRVLEAKDSAREGRPVSAGSEDAAAAGFEAGPYNERLHRALWHLIAGGELEGVVGPTPPPDDLEPKAVYRITQTGRDKSQDG